MDFLFPPGERVQLSSQRRNFHTLVVLPWIVACLESERRLRKKRKVLQKRNLAAIQSLPHNTYIPKCISCICTSALCWMVVSAGVLLCSSSVRASSQMRLRSLCVRRRPTGPRHGKGGPNGRQRAPAFVLIPTDARLGGFGLEVWGGIH